MSTDHDHILYGPADSTVALAPQRVITLERVALKREHKRANKARAELSREVHARTFDQRLIETQEESIRRWAALHAHAEARLRRWQAAWGVTIVLALGYVLVYIQIGH